MGPQDPHLRTSRMAGRVGDIASGRLYVATARMPVYSVPRWADSSLLKHRNLSRWGNPPAAMHNPANIALVAVGVSAEITLLPPRPSPRPQVQACHSLELRSSAQSRHRRAQCAHILDDCLHNTESTQNPSLSQNILRGCCPLCLISMLGYYPNSRAEDYESKHGKIRADPGHPRTQGQVPAS